MNWDRLRARDLGRASVRQETRLHRSLERQADRLLQEKPRPAKALTGTGINVNASLPKSVDVEIWTDGACFPNPGPGGWGVVIKDGDDERELSGGDPQTTNNRMELMAAIAGLEAVLKPSRVRLYSDSRYVLDGITSWMPKWKARGWRTYDKKPVKNVDLWRRLDAAAAPHEIEWKWVRGHAGNVGNERADALAEAAVPAPTPLGLQAIERIDRWLDRRALSEFRERGLVDE